MTFLTDEIDASGCSTASSPGRVQSGGKIRDPSIVSSSSLADEVKEGANETSEDEEDEEESDEDDDDNNEEDDNGNEDDDD